MEIYKPTIKGQPTLDDYKSDRPSDGDLTADDRVASFDVDGNVLSKKYVGSAGSQNLQSVTDIGSTTTNPITSPSFVGSHGYTNKEIFRNGTNAENEIDIYSGDTFLVSELTETVNFILTNPPVSPVTKDIQINLTGNQSFTFAGYTLIGGGVYDGAKVNQLIFSINSQYKTYTLTN